MTHDEARDLLLLHAYSHPLSVEHPKAQSGFLGSLRPYSGALDPRNFHEVMAALEALAPALETASLDRDIVSALWSITHLGRTWGVDPNGMLRRNLLISDVDVATLESWTDTISYAVFCLLGGTGLEVAFHDYRRSYPDLAAQT